MGRIAIGGFFKRITLGTSALVIAFSSASLALSFLIANTTSVSAATFSVCPSGCDQTSIQTALDGANNGDTITVGPGTYNESEITINKSVVLAAEPGAKIIVPNNPQVNAINVFANDVTISGFEIAGPVNSSYKTYAWGSNISRGIAVSIGVTGFTITNNNIHDVRNGVLINGINSTGALTNNVIENTKGAVSVQYTDGTGVAMTGNSQGANGNAWGVNLHLNGHYDGTTYYTNAQKIATDAPAAAQQIITNNAASNNNWTVQDQGYATSNRSVVYVANSGSATNQGDPLGPIDTIQNGVQAVVSGGTVHVVAGTYPMTSTITIAKPVSIQGTTGATITTSGGNHIFVTTAPNVSIKDLAFTKTDKTTQNLINIQGANSTISGNTFSGQYALGEGEVARALEVSTTSGLTINNNTFTALRQPAYINDNATGQITNNYVSGTRGWVLVANTNFSFTGNTWGSNAVDIAFIPGSPNNYNCAVMNTIRTTNNNANINNQTLVNPCPLDTPTNLTPANNTVTNNTAFTNTWFAVAGAAKYEYRTANVLNGSELGPIIYSDDSTSSNYNTSGSTITRSNNGTPDAPYYWQVRAIDAYGVPSAWSVINLVTVDSNAPATPTNVSLKVSATNVNIANNTGTNQADVTAAWQNGSSEPVTYIYKYWNDIPGNQYKVGSEYTVNTSGTTNAGTFNQGQGMHHFCIVAIDAAGNQSGCSTPFNVIYDTTKPTMVVNTANNSVNPATISATATDNIQLKQVTAHIYDANNTVLKKNCSVTVTDLATASYTIHCDTANLAEGTYTIRANASDQAGNISTTVSSVKFVVDHTAPTANLVFQSPGPAAKSFQVVFSEAVKQTDAENPANYFLHNWPGGGTFDDLTAYATVSYNAGTKTATITFTDAGWWLSAEQQWGVRAIHDLADNQLVETAAYTTPMTPPSAPGTPTTTNPTNNTTLDWNWAAASDPGGNDASGVKGYYYSLSKDGAEIIGATFTTALSATTGTAGDGTYVLSVYAVDNAGNASAVATGSTSLDTTGPATTINSVNTSTRQPDISGTVSDAGALVTVYLDGAIIGQTYAVIMPNFDGTYDWSLPVPNALADGTYQVMASATDGLGNVSAASAQQEFTVNLTVTPTAPLTINTAPAFTLSATTVNGLAIPIVLGSTTTATDDDVLSSQTALPGATDFGQVKADSTTLQDNETKACGNLLGLCWYWWVVIAVGVITVLYFLVRSAGKDEVTGK